MPFDPSHHPHRRFNPLTGTWVIVSPQRAERPWNGSTDSAVAAAPTYDPECYLCPGNERAGGIRNAAYDTTFVFENDFAALHTDSPAPEDVEPTSLFRSGSAAGECRVICFAPRHDLTLANMEPHEVLAVIDLWCDQMAELSERYEWVQIFETRGAISGASNPHPHGQIWASEFLPDEAAAELEAQRRYQATNRRHLLLDYAEQEVELGVRTVTVDEHWAVVVPYWAYWPFETLILPRRPVASLTALNRAERESLAMTLQAILHAYDRVFDTPFPYCSGWHSAPTHHADSWQLHGHYYPPLLRSADIAKIPASYELLAGLQRDMTPEAAAASLRDRL